jgi:hypothetical protein
VAKNVEINFNIISFLNKNPNFLNNQLPIQPKTYFRCCIALDCKYRKETESLSNSTPSRTPFSTLYST